MTNILQNKNFLNNQNYIVGPYFKESYRIYIKQNDSTNNIIGFFYFFILIGFINGFFQGNNGFFESSRTYFIVFIISLIFMCIFYLKYKAYIVTLLSAFLEPKKQIILLKSPMLYRKNILIVPIKNYA